MERENLAGDAKGKDTSGCNRKVESTDAPVERYRSKARSSHREIDRNALVDGVPAHSDESTGEDKVSPILPAIKILSPSVIAVIRATNSGIQPGLSAP
jgi:hypothetical protein